MNKEKVEEKLIPRKPTKHELGGGYYYTCYWIICNEQLKRWWNFCPICGTEIDWSNEDV